jgi:glycine/D-amino acid oxidase-like deaminating enzyme
MTVPLPPRSHNLWADSAAAGRGFADPLPDAGEQFDAIVVGAGVTGLSTALAMTDVGLRPLVLERRSVGAGTSGRSTAKVSVLQGDRTHQIERRHGEQTTQAHVRANLDGLEQIRLWSDRLQVPVETRDAWSYATDQEGAARLGREVEAAQRAGLAVSAEQPTELPYSTTAAVRLPDQLQLEPLGYLQALADAVRGAGGHVVEGAAVTAVSDAGGDGLTRVRLDGGEQVRAPWVVLATLLPFPLRTLLFATSRPVRSYLLAAEIDDDVVAPESMYLSVSQPTRSLRVATTPQGRHLLVGGNSHVTGRSHPTSAKVRDLADWAASQLGVRTITHRWSAQDYTPADLLPHVGSVPGTNARMPGRQWLQQVGLHCRDGSRAGDGRDGGGSATLLGAGLVTTRGRRTLGGVGDRQGEPRGGGVDADRLAVDVSARGRPGRRRCRITRARRRPAGRSQPQRR